MKSLYRDILIAAARSQKTVGGGFFSFFFQGTYTLSRKIVRNRAVSIATGWVIICKKKKLVPEWDLNCCTPAWRSELLPAGLQGSANKC